MHVVSPCARLQGELDASYGAGIIRNAAAGRISYALPLQGRPWRWSDLEAHGTETPLGEDMLEEASEALLAEALAMVQQRRSNR